MAKSSKSKELVPANPHPLLYYIAKYRNGARFPFLNWDPVCWDYDLEALKARPPIYIPPLKSDRCVILVRREDTLPSGFDLLYEWSLGNWCAPSVKG
jgi:hypothetical protein